MKSNVDAIWNEKLTKLLNLCILNTLMDPLIWIIIIISNDIK